MWISINNREGRPIYLQIINQVKKQVYEGTLKPGDELPSVRELADLLGVNMHTVRTAYLKLREQEMISLRLGRRATINRLSQIGDDTRILEELRSEINEAITDAILAGLSPEMVRLTVSQELKQLEDKKEKR
jgi:GntR family transcriptional regulator